MPLLVTPRLRLEPVKNSHLEELYCLNKDINVMKYISGRVVSLDETLEHMEMVKKNWINLGYSSWCFFDRGTNEFVGSGGVQHIAFHSENPVEIGWRLKPTKWRQGYATEAARCMMQFVFQSTNLDCLVALCHQENRKSENVMRRLGMIYVGIEHWYDLDVIVYKIQRSKILEGLAMETSRHIQNSHNFDENASVEIE
jgi:ribosomal-protein-alanine N-acetyltransferase